MSISSVNPDNPSKPYLLVPIEDCGEPLVPIPSSVFTLESPPPYAKLGADYRGSSPYCLRQGVLSALIVAQKYLAAQYPGWKLKVFDAYRPVEVQKFMVEHTFKEILEQKGLKKEDLSQAEEKLIWQQVYTIWAVPSNNLQTPPPHSTGAAIDLTLVNEKGEDLDMGGEIDELSARSEPNYYQDKPEGIIYQSRREILLNVMFKAGFRRHLGEWWHFSLGDQMWTWQYNLENPTQPLIARYGRVE